MEIKNIIYNTTNEFINENFDNNAYKTWKRKNVTLRGIKNLGEENGVYGSYGNGLYTVPLGNKAMAKQYGVVHYVVNAIPKNPKIVNNINEAEMLRQNLVNNYCIENGVKYNPRYFEDNTSMDKEMLKIGYDGLIIKGREMVNYTPTDVKYFKDENQLINYYNYNNSNLNEATASADKAFYDKADDFYEKMIIELNHGNYYVHDNGNITFKASEVNLYYPDLIIMFVDANTPATSTPFGDTSAKGNYGFGTLNRNKYIIVPNLRKDKNPSKGISKDSFIHEFIHYLDYVRSKGKFKEFNQNTTISDYYNSPSEYNAYYQEAANYLVNLLKDEMVLNKIKEKYPTFDGFYKFMLDNVFSKRFIANLNDKNILKLKKRVYNIYSEYVENNSSNNSSLKTSNNINEDIQLIRGVGKNETSNVDLFGKGLYLTDNIDVANHYGDNIKKYSISGNIFDTTKDFNQNELDTFFKTLDKIFKTNIGTKYYNELISMNDGQQPYIDYIGVSWALDSRPEFQTLLKQNNLQLNTFNSYANVCTAMNIVLKKMGYSGLKYSTSEIEDLDDNGLGDKNAYLIFNKASIKELI